MDEPTYPIAYTSDPGVTLTKATRSPELSKPEAAEGFLAPNPDRTHIGQPPVRLYVAIPRGAS